MLTVQDHDRLDPEGSRRPVPKGAGRRGAGSHAGGPANPNRGHPAGRYRGLTLAGGPDDRDHGDTQGGPGQPEDPDLSQQSATDWSQA